MSDIKNFLDEQGRLKQFPVKRRMKLAALFYLAQKLEPGKSYRERQINDLLNEWSTFGDPATLRRELYDFGFVDRAADGSVYTLADPQPEPDND